MNRIKKDDPCAGTLSRRNMIGGLAAAGLAATKLSASPAEALAEGGPCRMFSSLSPGSIGMKTGPKESIALAAEFGFGGVEPNAAFLADLSLEARNELRAEMKSKGLRFGTGGLPVDFRGDEARFRSQLEALPRLAQALQAAEVGRVGTWIMPGHRELTYLENFRQHAARLREVARILKDSGLRLGLEYVGTPTVRQPQRYPFLHTMRELRELIGEIGTGNVGFLLDSWHWWTAGETEADIAALQPAEVVSVDLNDAPAGIPLEQQQDGKRELPCATGVIPVAAFLGALLRIGYDGPVRAEPFNKALNDMEDREACAAAAAALKKALALAGCR